MLDGLVAILGYKTLEESRSGNESEICHRNDALYLRLVPVPFIVSLKIEVLLNVFIVSRTVEMCLFPVVIRLSRDVTPIGIQGYVILTGRTTELV